MVFIFIPALVLTIFFFILFHFFPLLTKTILIFILVPTFCSFIYFQIVDWKKDKKREEKSIKDLMDARLKYPKYTIEELEKDKKYIKIKEIIKEHLSSDIKLSPSTKLITDLDLDSLDLMEIMMNIEEEFNVDFSDIDFNNDDVTVVDLWGLCPKTASQAS